MILPKLNQFFLNFASILLKFRLNFAQIQSNMPKSNQFCQKKKKIARECGCIPSFYGIAPHHVRAGRRRDAGTENILGWLSQKDDVSQAIREFQGNSWMGTLMKGALVFFVHTSASHTRRRMLIRSTWGAVRDLEGWK